MHTYVLEIDDGRVAAEPYELGLADLNAARVEAARLLGAMIKDAPEEFWATMDWRVRVSDDAGLLMFEIHAFAVEAPAAVSR